jgi:hypothetical protein
MNRSLFRRATAGAALGCAALVITAVVPSAAHAAPAVKQVSQRPGNTYIAAGQYILGPPLYEPACTKKFDCALSGDATAFLYRMRWTQCEVTQIFRTRDPIGFSPERNGIKCRGNRKDTLLNLRSRPPRRW